MAVGGERMRCESAAGVAVRVREEAERRGWLRVARWDGADHQSSVTLAKRVRERSRRTSEPVPPRPSSHAGPKAAGRGPVRCAAPKERRYQRGGPSTPLHSAQSLYRNPESSVCRTFRSPKAGENAPKCLVSSHFDDQFCSELSGSRDFYTGSQDDRALMVRANPQPATRNPQPATRNPHFPTASLPRFGVFLLQRRLPGGTFAHGRVERRGRGLDRRPAAAVPTVFILIWPDVRVRQMIRRQKIRLGMPGENHVEEWQRQHHPK